MNVAVAETRRTFPKSVQPGIPKIKPPQAGTKRYTFGDLFEVVQRPVKLNDAKEYDLVTVKRARGGIEHRARMKGSQVAVKSQFYLEEGDFLISKRQIVHGACGIVSADFTGSIVSNEYSVLRCKPEIDLQYLGYLSHSIYFQQTCFHSSIGVHIEKMIFKLGDWFKWPINLPSLPEQKKIAAFLGVVDAKISALRDRVAGLERYKRGLMQALFSQTLRFTKPDGTSFPDWEKKRLGEVFSERSERGNEDAELLSVTISRGVRRAADVDRANGASADRSNYKTVHINDIAYNSMRMWQGANGVSEYFGIVSPAYTVITPQADQVPAFWGYYFKLTTVIQEFQRHSQGLTSDTWNLKFPALSSIRLAIPHPGEQAKIAEALSAMDAKIAAVTGQLDRMQDFKKGLLQQMFV